jgi:uncharacterized Rmd1/YagE family protein
LQYGVVVFWGLTQQEEDDFGLTAVSCAKLVLPAESMKRDDFEFNYSAKEPPHIQDDVITINPLSGKDHQVGTRCSTSTA